MGNKKSLLKIFRNIFGVLFLVCVVLVVIEWYKYYSMRALNNKINEQVIVQKEETEASVEASADGIDAMQQNGSDAIQYTFLPEIDFEKLEEINEKCVGWIYACDGEISYPIVASEDEFYLHHSIDGTESKAGAIFVNSSSENPFEENRAVLYGHNMKDGSMFRPLLQYWQEEEYLKQHPEIYIITKQKIYVYKVATAYVKEYQDIEFVTSTEQKENPVLDLITCEYSGKDTRLVVEAVLE